MHGAWWPPYPGCRVQGRAGALVQACRLQDVPSDSQQPGCETRCLQVCQAQVWGARWLVQWPHYARGTLAPSGRVELVLASSHRPRVPCAHCWCRQLGSSLCAPACAPARLRRVATLNGQAVSGLASNLPPLRAAPLLSCAVHRSTGAILQRPSATAANVNHVRAPPGAWACWAAQPCAPCAGLPCASTPHTSKTRYTRHATRRGCPCPGNHARVARHMTPCPARVIFIAPHTRQPASPSCALARRIRHAAVMYDPAPASALACPVISCPYRCLAHRSTQRQGGFRRTPACCLPWSWSWAHWRLHAALRAICAGPPYVGTPALDWPAASLHT